MNKDNILLLFEKIINELNVKEKVELKVINKRKYEVCGTFCMRGNIAVIHINKYYNKDIIELHDTICHELAHCQYRMYHTKKHKSLTHQYKIKTKHLIK